MLARCPVIGGSGQQEASAGTGKSVENSKSKVCSLPVTSLVAGHEVCGRKIHLRQEFGHRWVYGFLTDFNPETYKHRFVQAANPSPDIDGPMAREASSGLTGKNPGRRNGTRGSFSNESGPSSLKEERNRDRPLARTSDPSSCNNLNACRNREGESHTVRVERVANSDLDDFDEIGGSEVEEGFQGGVSEEADVSEGGELVDEWICLGKRLFRWCDPPPQNSPPNPTFKDFPGDEAAIGWKVRVYWNEMGRWYVGHVRNFDSTTGRHEIRFCDGDVRLYILRNEPVLWIDKPVCSRKRKDRKEDSDEGDSARKSQKSALSNGVKSGSQYPATAPGQAREWDCTGADCTGTGSLASTLPTRAREVRKKEIVFSHCCLPSSQPEASLGHGHPGQQLGTVMRELPDHKGSSNGLMKEESEAELNAWQLRPRRGLPLTGAYRNPRFSVLKARVGIFWEGDIRYYRGTIKSFNELSGKYTICYDDNTKEDLALEEEKFEWYGPRGRSNGYSSVVRDTMLDLGAQGLPKGGASVPSPLPISEELCSLEPNTLVGKRVFIYWAANGRYYEGEVLAYCKKRKMHLVWYKDGEVEWLDLGKENVIMGEHTRGCSFSSGVPDKGGEPHLRPTPLHSWGHEDEEPPRGRAAMGWRIAVFWKDDAAFYEGKVTGYNCATGRHDVLYDDNETENLSLSSEKVIWRIPPNCRKISRNAYRKKFANFGKSRASSQSDVSGKERVASGDNPLFTAGGLQPVAHGAHKLKFGLHRGRDKTRRKGSKACQSASKQLDTVPRRKAAVEGESEVLGPPYPGKQELNSPNANSSRFEMEAEEVQAQDHTSVVTSTRDRTEKYKERGSNLVGVDGVDRSREYESRLKEEVATNATVSENTAHVRSCEEGRDDLACEPKDENPLRIATLGLLESRQGSLQKQYSQPGSPMSTDADSVDEGNGSLQPKPCDVPFDKELPSVDVTRLVRLPPEFGSLEVKLRITAGARPVSQDGNQAAGPLPELPKNGTDAGERGDEADEAQTLQKRISSIDHILKVIDRYEVAHRTLGHVATRCDQMAMAEVLSTESLAGRDNIGKGVAGTGTVPIASEKPGNVLTTRESASLGSVRVSVFETAGKKMQNKKQKKMPSALLSGFSGNLDVPVLQTVGSSQPSLPSSSNVQITAKTAGLGTSHFGVSSLPAIPQVARGPQNSGVGCDAVDPGLPQTRQIEMETDYNVLDNHSLRERGSKKPAEKLVEDPLKMRSSSRAEGVDVFVSEGLDRGSHKNGMGDAGN